MTELINPPAALAYDPDSDGWTPPPGLDTPPTPRPAAARVRCGEYLHPLNRQQLWGDHRVSFPGSSCTETCCYVSHYGSVAPGWPEPVDPEADGYTMLTRPGVHAIASVLLGWNDAGHLRNGSLSEQNALHAAHLVLDALRDARFRVVPPEPTAVGVASVSVPTPAPTPMETDASQ